MLRTFSPLLFTAALFAQNITAYPQDTIQNNSGNLVPFGVIGTAGNFAEGHTQVLIPAPYLPGTGVSTGMWVHCQNVAALTYGSLQITMSPTTVTSLSSTFATNLTAPQVVLAATNLTVNYTGQWVQIPFTTPYVHDGTSSVVIDIQKVVVPPLSFATMSTTSNPARSDLPPMVYAFGLPGSGANTAPIANISASTLAVRLDWTGVPTMRLLSNRFGANNNQFAIGGSITDTVNGTPGSLYVNQVGTALQNMTLPPIVGVWRVNGVTLNLGTLSATGDAALTIPIPSNPALVGLYLAFESITLDAITSVPQFTNAADCFLRN